MPAPVAINLPLTNTSIAAFQDAGDFIATQVFPTIPSGPPTGVYYKFDMDAIRRDEAGLRARGTESEDADYGLTAATYNCGMDYSLRAHIPKEDIDQARETLGSAVDLEQSAVEMLAEKILIKRERRFGTAYWGTGKWARDVSGAGTNTPAETSTTGTRIYWSTSSATPIKDIQAESRIMRLRSGRRATALFLGYKVAEELLNHPTVLAHPTIMAPARSASFNQVTLDDLATLLKVDKVVIAAGTYNSGKQGQSASNSYILDSTSALLAHIPARPGIRTPGAGYRFTWRGTTGNNEGIASYSYWHQPRMAQRIETHVYESFEMAGAEFGTFFNAIVQ